MWVNRTEWTRFEYPALPGCSAELHRGGDSPRSPLRRRQQCVGELCLHGSLKANYRWNNISTRLLCSAELLFKSWKVVFQGRTFILVLPLFFPPLWDVSHGELGADSAAHRSRDEWELRVHRRGALPLRPLLCYLWDRHRNWTGTGRISRYVLYFVAPCWFWKKNTSTDLQLNTILFKNIPPAPCGQSSATL